MITTQPFGTTGHQSSRVIFGAAALGGMSQGRADSTIEMLRDYGINHIDTAASYGESELRLTDFLADHRSDVFLATKTGSRTASDARAELEVSLNRLGVRHVDLIQLHNLVEEAEWLTAFSPGGAVEALFKARDEGLCRHVGITGHGLRIAQMHVRSLAEAPFASVLFPWNHVLAQNADYAADVAMLNEVCETYGVARQTIKSIARRRWDNWDQAKYSWYQPLDDPSAIGRAVEFVLSDERYFLNTSSDARLLQVALDVAGAHKGDCPSDDALKNDRDEFGMLPLFDGEALEVIR
ncbi:MAG: aldo/keto reductase [Acidimicrobiaceae bacterium]|jgi:aryl-alcohol dehydrogenase-like predicted oxidoreductase|nr:aldo/keto reductase [Acidimicrobiaceae bacterium]MBT5579876.1 aldo/keto reductase [Acidimicrobiaceae bacterium]MBT5851577.1 aldo/keto reductase [Acidimicrobiaceae bacterium]